MDETLQPGWLDVAGYLEGTLKSSLWVDILRHYERHLAEWKDADIEILEIGVNTGSSLEVWKKYFTRAKFIGVDINPRCRSFAGERIKIEIGSQEDPEFLRRLVTTYKPSIIIDDGSHLAHHIPFTFEFLFPFLAPGGLYVIEDMFFHLGPNPQHYMGFSETRPNEYLFDIVRQLFTERPDPKLSHGMKAFLRAQVEEIAFAPLGVAFLRKKAKPIPLEKRVAMGEAYAQQEGRSILWARLAEYASRHEGAGERAETLARKAVSVEPENVYAQRTLAAMLQGRGKWREAADAGEKAVELEPGDGGHHDLVGQIYLKLQDLSKAEDSFRKAVALRGNDPHIRRRLDDVLRAQGKSEAPTT